MLFSSFGLKTKLKCKTQDRKWLRPRLVSRPSSLSWSNYCIDENLKFDHHMIDIERKISNSVSIISKLRYFMPQKALLHDYYALLHPNFLYGLPVWGST